MVHALRVLHRVLEPGGTLVDIRPAPGLRPALEVHRRAAPDAPGPPGHGDPVVFPCGVVDETDGGIEYRLAAAASAFACASGRFTLETRRQIEFRRYAPSLDVLLAYLAEHWRDAVIAPDTQERVRALLAEHGSRGELVVREQVLVERLVAPPVTPPAA